MNEMDDFDWDWAEYWKRQAHEWEVRAWLSLALAAIIEIYLILQIYA